MLIFNYFEQGDEKKGDQGTDYEVNLNLKAQEIIVHAGRVRVRHRRSCWGLCGWRRPCWPWRGWSGWRGGWGPWTGWWGSVVRPLGTVWNSNECLQHTHTLSWTPSNFYKMVNIWVAGFASCIFQHFQLCTMCTAHVIYLANNCFLKAWIRYFSPGWTSLGAWQPRTNISSNIWSKISIFNQVYDQNLWILNH